MVLFLILLLSRAIFGLSERQLRLRAVLRMAKERAGVFSDIVGSLNLLRASLVQTPCSGRLKKKKQKPFLLLTTKRVFTLTAVRAKSASNGCCISNKHVLAASEFSRALAVLFCYRSLLLIDFCRTGDFTHARPVSYH